VILCDVGRLLLMLMADPHKFLTKLSVFVGCTRELGFRGGDGVGVDSQLQLC